MFDCFKKKPALPVRDKVEPKNAWEELIMAYQKNDKADHLKVASLSQWIIESGRGTSRLATEHLNFGGLKYRKELEGVSVPVRYKAWDGWDTYCKFESVEKFIEGYWIFMNRSPYKPGMWWESKSVEEYLRSIVPPYTTPAEPYIKKCLRVADEAAELLETEFEDSAIRELPMPDEKPSDLRLAVVVGHSKSAQGAALTNGVREYVYNKAIAEIMANKASRYGIQMEIFYRDRGGRRGAYERVRDWGPDVQIELHFNAFNGKVTGTETLSTFDKQDVAYANIVQSHMCRLLRRPGKSRGVKRLKRGDRAAVNMYGYSNNPLKWPNCLPEPAFGDVKSEADLLIKHQVELADVYLKATREFWDRNMEN